ncbi:MAG: 16S rRNA (guanine(527)-N(7))-methyltransferase RsmG [Steroidobacteraceae bacterium]|nr:16S rRNA (guanine(527)-N(7))-methyltransferase RsmG [Steroidobacteraceae bacterium]
MELSDQREWSERLDAGAKQLGVELDQSQCEVLWRYAHMLRERNEHVNLTSITSAEGILTLHMLDSLTVAPHLGDAKRIIDVGTGGGFPGVPLAVACPQRQFTLIDGTAKKIRFVEESVAALDIRNVQLAHARAESYTGEKNFDVVVARAVGALADLVHNAAGLLAAGGRLFAMKARSPEEEVRALPRGWHVEVIDLAVPGLDAERRLVVLSRQRAA